MGAGALPIRADGCGYAFPEACRVRPSPGLPSVSGGGAEVAAYAVPVRFAKSGQPEKARKSPLQARPGAVLSLYRMHGRRAYRAALGQLCARGERWRGGADHPEVIPAGGETVLFRTIRGAFCRIWYFVQSRTHPNMSNLVKGSIWLLFYPVRFTMSNLSNLVVLYRTPTTMVG